MRRWGFALLSALVQVACSSGEPLPLAASDGGTDGPPTDLALGVELRTVQVTLEDFDAYTTLPVTVRAFDARGATRFVASFLPVADATRPFTYVENADASTADLIAYLDMDGDGALDESSDTVFAATMTPASPEATLTPTSGAAIAVMPAHDRLPVHARMVRFEHHLGKSLSMRITDHASGVDTALVVLDAVSEDSFTLSLDDAVEPNTLYDVLVFLDVNDNGVYDLHGDFGLMFQHESDSSGLSFEHDHFDER